MEKIGKLKSHYDEVDSDADNGQNMMTIVSCLRLARVSRSGAVINVG